MKTLLCAGLLVVSVSPGRAHDPYYDFGPTPYGPEFFQEVSVPPAMPIVYQAPVVYHAPVVYEAPVVYYGPVYYISAPEPWTDFYPAPVKSFSAASTVTVIGGKSGPYTYSNWGNHCGSTVVHLSGRRYGF